MGLVRLLAYTANYPTKEKDNKKIYSSILISKHGITDRINNEQTKDVTWLYHGYTNL